MQAEPRPQQPNACTACGGELRPWNAVRSGDPTITGTFEILRCQRCGSLVTASPPWEDSYETGTYRPQRSLMTRLAAPLLRSFERHRIRLVRALIPPPARLLDAGAGRGRFVQEAARAGYEASGIEPSERGVQSAAAQGIELQQATIDGADVAPGSLDIVSLSHVLEHLDELDPTLERIRTWLRPGGVLMIGVPNVSSLQARLSGTRWFFLDVPRHRTNFTPDGLRALLARNGFESPQFHHVLAEHNPLGMWQSILNLVTEQRAYFYNLLKGNASPRSRDLPISLLGLPLIPVAMLLELIAGALGRGGTVVLLARAAERPASPASEPVPARGAEYVSGHAGL